MQHRRPAVERAVAYLERLVGEVEDGAVRRLPVRAELARQAGVSVVSMSKALDMLRSRGRIAANHRRGTFALAPGAKLVPPKCVQRLNKSERVVRHLRADVLSRRFRPDTVLPSACQLARRYDTSPRTAGVALGRLAETGVVVPYKRGYRVPALPARPGHNRLVVFTRELYTHHTLEMPLRRQELFRALEQRCHQANIELAFVRYRYVMGKLILDDTARCLVSSDEALDAAYGFVIWASGLEQIDIPHLLARLAALRKPVAVLDDTGERGLASVVRQPLQRVFSLSHSAQAGRAMGTYLLRREHRNVAYFSTDHAAAWSRRRLHGLRETLGGAAISVEEYTVDGRQSAEPLDETLRINAAIERMVASGLSLDRAIDQEVRRAMTRMKGHIRAQIRRDRRVARVEELLEKALAARRATVWIGASDEVALHCLEFLHSRSIHVPGDISVVGFDDTLEAYAARLTSYNFNVPAVLDAMLEHVLRPTTGALSREKLPVSEIEGFVVERESVTGAEGRG